MVVRPVDASWTFAVQGRRVQVWADGVGATSDRAFFGRGRARLDLRVLAVIALCAALPVLIGVLLTAGTVRSDPPAAQPTAGHWVYVPSQGVAVHVDGATKRVDATVAVGSALAGSPVLQDRQAAYLVDDDRVIVFGPGGVTGEAPTEGLAERPVPIEAGGAAYLVYRTAGVIVRLGPKPVTVTAGGPLGAPVVTPDGRLWTYEVDSGKVCSLNDKATLDCPSRVPAGHTGALAVLDGRPGFVDVTESRWQALDGREPVALGVSLPTNAAVGPAAVGGRLAIVDPNERRLLLIATSGEVTPVRLGDGSFGPPVSTGDAVAVVDADTGAITSYDASGRRRHKLTMPSGAVGLTTGADGRAYADSTDGLQSVVMDRDGTLTAVPTTGDTPPTYREAAPTPSVSLPPATVAVTTTETVPPVPETVTVPANPTTGAPGVPPAAPDPRRAPGTDPPNTDPPNTDPPATTRPPAGSPPGRPTVDVLSAEPAGTGRARLQIRVRGAGPVFCHVFFNSVERAATRCSGTMTVVVTGLAPNTTYDVYVLGTNATGTGVPGRRAVFQS